MAMSEKPVSLGALSAFWAVGVFRT
jgi:hypothetical protein